MATATYAGVDLSYCQTKVDYRALSNAKINGKKVKYAMLRFSHGTTKDKMFDQHYTGCKDAGIYVGIYHWTYAETPTQAIAEATWLVEKLKAYEIDYPVALDFEEPALIKLGLQKQQYTAIVNAFMKVLQDNNYYVCLYTNPDWLKNRLMSTIPSTYDIWLAQWTNGTPADYGQTIWQYHVLGSQEDVIAQRATKVGSVDGIIGAIDVDLCYVGYASKIKKLNKNVAVTDYTITASGKLTSDQLIKVKQTLADTGLKVSSKKS